MADLSYYGIAELVWQSNREGLPSNRFYILETSITLDGPRTRVHRGGFASREVAQIYIDAKRKELGLP